MGVIPLMQSTLEDLSNNTPLCFKISPAPQTKLQAFLIVAQSQQDFKNWLEVLQQSIYFLSFSLNPITGKMDLPNYYNWIMVAYIYFTIWEKRN